MIIIPAIDIKEGRCVRLRQGRMEDETIFAENPVEMADKWIEAGAKRLHIVDLDGATSGAPRNFEIIQEIAAKYPDVPLQVGGGIRDEDTVQDYLNCGVQYIIIGTRAVTAPHFVNDLCLEFPGHIIVGLDAKNGKVAIDGWSKLSHPNFLVHYNLKLRGLLGVVYCQLAVLKKRSPQDIDIFKMIRGNVCEDPDAINLHVCLIIRKVFNLDPDSIPRLCG